MHNEFNFLAGLVLQALSKARLAIKRLGNDPLIAVKGAIKVLATLPLICIAPLLAKNAPIMDARLQNLHSLYYEEQKNSQAAGDSQALNCILDSKERALATTTYHKSDVYAYGKALGELRDFELKRLREGLQQGAIESAITKTAKDLLMLDAQLDNPLALLLSLQLHFAKLCERCEKARRISGLEAYYKRESSPANLLEAQGLAKLEVSNSPAFKGEAFLCRGLESKKPLDFLFAYANFYLAGLNTRAVNALLEGLALSHEISYETRILLDSFMFLALRDLVIAREPLVVLRLQGLVNTYVLAGGKGVDLKSLISSLPHFQNLLVLEYNLGADFVLNSLLTNDMETRRILSPLNPLRNQESIEEFLEAKKKHNSWVEAHLFRLLKRASNEELEAYSRLLKLKKRLKDAKQYPHARALVVDHFSWSK